jgi:hypothetical protein
MDTLMVLIILVGAAVYIGRTYYRQWRAVKDSNDGCGCNSACSTCNIQSDSACGGEAGSKTQ